MTASILIIHPGLLENGLKQVRLGFIIGIFRRRYHSRNELNARLGIFDDLWRLTPQDAPNYLVVGNGGQGFKAAA